MALYRVWQIAVAAGSIDVLADELAGVGVAEGPIGSWCGDCVAAVHAVFTHRPQWKKIIIFQYMSGTEVPRIPETASLHDGGFFSLASIFFFPSPMAE